MAIPKWKSMKQEAGSTQTCLIIGRESTTTYLLKITVTLVRLSMKVRILEKINDRSSNRRQTPKFIEHANKIGIQRQIFCFYCK